MSFDRNVCKYDLLPPLVLRSPLQVIVRGLEMAFHVLLSVVDNIGATCCAQAFNLLETKQKSVLYHIRFHKFINAFLLKCTTYMDVYHKNLKCLSF